MHRLLLLICFGLLINPLISQPVLNVEPTKLNASVPDGGSAERIIALDNSSGSSQLEYEISFGPLLSANGQEANLSEDLTLNGQVFYLGGVRSSGVLKNREEADFLIEYLEERGVEVRVIEIDSTDYSLIQKNAILLLTDIDLIELRNSNQTRKINEWVKAGGSLWITSSFDRSNKSESRVHELLEGTDISLQNYFVDLSPGVGSNGAESMNFFGHPITNTADFFIYAVDNPSLLVSNDASALAFSLDSTNRVVAAVDRYGNGKVMIQPDVITSEVYFTRSIINPFVQIPFMLPYTVNTISYLYRKWGVVNNQTGGLAPGKKGFLTVTFDGNGILKGQVYNSTIEITSNDPKNLNVSVPVSFRPCTGDCNPLFATPAKASPGDTVFISPFSLDIDLTESEFVKFNNIDAGFGIKDNSTLFAIVPDVAFGSGTFKVRIASQNYKSDEVEILLPEFNISPGFGARGDTIYFLADLYSVSDVTSVRFQKTDITFGIKDTTTLFAIIPSDARISSDVFKVILNDGRKFKSELLSVLSNEPSQASDLKFAQQICREFPGPLTTMDVSWTQGDGTGNFIVVVGPDATSEYIPQDGDDFNMKFDQFSNTGTDTLTGSDILRPKDPFRIQQNFLPGEYKVILYTYRGSDGNINYAQDTSVAFVKLEQLAPTIGIEDQRALEITDQSARIAWTKGNGDKTLVSIGNEFTPGGSARNCNSYLANPEFGLGDILPGFNSEEYVIYNGLKNTFVVTGLKPEASYVVSFYSFNKSSLGPQYTVSTSVTFRTADALAVSNLEVYPNPFSTNFEVELYEQTNSPAQIKLYDLSGNLVEELNYTNKDRVNVGANLKKGMYVLKVYQGGKVYEKVVVKE